MPSEPALSVALIALDWGTSSLRAYAMSASGAVLAERAAPLGIMQVANGDFAGALRTCCADWLAASPQAVLIASGMIGSKQGWREAPYCACPADAAAIARAMATVTLDDGRMLHIVPGVSFVDPVSGVPDVMRGEETQLIGALPASGSQLAVLPGTHSKWVWVEEGVIVHFSSWMTGEVYAALTQHTILGRLMIVDAPHDAAAFARGVHYGFDAPAQLLSRIFSVRTLGLFGQMDAAALPSYLSGVLIGAEIGAEIGTEVATKLGAASGASTRAESAPITLLGSAQLTQRYAAACVAVGIPAIAGAQDSAARGLFRLARATMLISC